VVTPGPTAGTLTVTASLPGTSSTANFTLSVVVLGSFTIVPASTQVGPVTQQISAMVALTITGSGGFNAPVTLTCSTPAGTTCSVSPITEAFRNGVEQPSPTGPTPILTFQSEGNLLGAGTTRGWWPAVATLLLSLLLIFGRRRRLGALLLAMVALLALGSVSGCSGAKYSPTTPNGTYTVTVTGTAQTVSASTTVTFTVQN